ncbi:MAG: neuraminidase-like domain-containing protein [Nitrospira sp.]|nr:neuraminidase-like domain-containing protein [Nitrospira sp.]MCP9461808.1 neuraminidase-like domain-containing protein [Nitrospira sp.]MCP9475817.1 neuraminidase-like domain-containing protein [Nitrospira sp.]
MNKITFPLKPQMRGQKVTNLQDALQLLLERGVIKALKPPNRPTADELRALAEALRAERASKVFGDATRQLVFLLQIQNGLGDGRGGVVDEPTAALFNRLIDKLTGEERRPEFVVRGTVRDVDGHPVMGALIRVFDRDMRREQPLGSTRTDANGRYRIEYSSQQFRRAEKGRADLVVRVVDAQGNERAVSETVFHADPDQVIDLTLPEDKSPNESEFEYILKQLTPLIENVVPAELTDQDLDFLANEARVPRERLTFIRLDAQWQRQTGLPAGVFYGLLRQGLPTDRRRLLAEPTSRIEQALKASLEQQIVPQRLSNIFKDILRQLNDLAVKMAFEPGDETMAVPLGLLLGTAPDLSNERGQAFVRFSLQNDGDEDFWDRLRDMPGFDDATVAAAQFTVGLGALSSHLPLVRLIQSERTQGRVTRLRDLASWTWDEWRGLIARAGVPPDTPGETEAEKTDGYATQMTRLVEAIFPTASVAYKLGRSTRLEIPFKRDISRFLLNTEGFDLKRTHIDSFVREHGAPADVPDVEGFTRELKRLQRVFKLAPEHDKFEAMEALLTQGLDSAHAVYARGEATLRRELSEPLGGESRVAEVVRKAGHIVDVSQFLHTAYAPGFRSTTPAVTGDPSPWIAETPDLRTLFGSQSFCACEHCRSVYSPAAYLVDLLHWLELVPGTRGDRNALAALSSRRPDLQEIELSCTNTNTVLPYIDLVNEMLERAVAPLLFSLSAADFTEIPALARELDDSVVPRRVRDAFAEAGVDLSETPVVTVTTADREWTIADSGRTYRVSRRGDEGLIVAPSTPQTRGSAEELRVHPEHIHAPAYERLAASIYPWTLPFDLFAEEARLFLEHLRVPRHRLMAVMRRDGAASLLEVASERLRLTAAEREILTGTGDRAPWARWGLRETGNVVDDPATGTTVSLAWIDALRRVPVFLRQSGLQLDEWKTLLEAKYVNPDGGLVIEFPVPATPEEAVRASTCDVEKARITLPSDEAQARAALERIEHFVRLRRKLGWSVPELDAALRALGGSGITTGLLIDLARILELREAVKVPLIELLSWWHTIDTVSYRNRPSLYDQVFLNKGVLNPVDPAFALNRDRTELVGAGSPLADHVTALMAGLGVTEGDLHALLQALDETSRSLNLRTLSALYRTVSLARALRLSVKDLLALKALSGRDPFADPRASHEFVETVALVRAMPIGIGQLDYLLNHRVEHPSASFVPGEAQTAQFLVALRRMLRAIEDETAETSDPTGERVRDALATLLPAEPAERAEILVRGTSTETEDAQRAFIGEHFAPFLAASGIAVADAQRALVGPDALRDQESRFNYVAPILLRYLRRSSLVKQQVATALGLEPAAADRLLTALVPARSDRRRPALADFLASEFVAGEIDPITRASLPHQFDSFVLLSKIAIIVKALGIPTTMLDWLFAQAPALGWLNLAVLPLTPTGPDDPERPARLAAWSRMARAARLEDELPRGSPSIYGLLALLNTVDAAAPASEKNGAKTAFFADLLERTRWRAEDLESLVGAADDHEATGLLGPRFPDDWSGERGLERLEHLAQVFRQLRVLGVSAEQAWSWSAPVMTASVASDIRKAVKARYDVEQWRRIATPLRDALRERQRDALVSYLIAHGAATETAPTFKNANDLFAYYLIDTEMSACMMTSRIKQANGAVQLFVQRCLMNLEPGLALTARDAEQWQWMKTYRVWEANRKVFLYPENWIEPELRDDKSPFFKELEHALLQNEVREDVVEKAFVTYLHRLGEVARLEMAGIYEQTEPGPDGVNVLHVFGRTRNTPHLYFYRRWVNRSYWTPWERVDVDIQGDHLIPVMWNRRLYLFWPIFTEKALESSRISETDTGIPPRKYWQIQLAWSEYRDGMWTAKHVSPTLTDPTDPSSPYVFANLSNYFFSASATRVDELVFHIARMTGATEIRGDIRLSGQDGVVRSSRGAHFPRRRGPLGSQAHYMKFQEAGPDGRFYLPTMAGNDRVLETTPGTYYILPGHQKHYFTATDGTFFYEDDTRTFCIRPGITARSDSPGRLFDGSLEPGRDLDVRFTSGYRFLSFYHPYVGTFINQLNRHGIDGLLAAERVGEVPLLSRQQIEAYYFGPEAPERRSENLYRPTRSVIQPYPKDEIDFSHGGAYSLYNWELFFHAPLLIADRLGKNQRFEEAMRWFHYIFDPTVGEDRALSERDRRLPARYWKVKPFFENEQVDEAGRPHAIRFLLSLLHYDGRRADWRALKAEFENQIRQWRDNPFKPHLIARLRISAYQWAVVMKYLDNLIAWGDQLFRKDTIESINEATLLYVRAAEILGERPVQLAGEETSAKTYRDLSESGLDAFGNAAIENLPGVDADGDIGGTGAGAPLFRSLYFCVPPNDKLLGYWDTVADRLFKIRHCMNIEGRARELPLFEPPIDPALLVRAAAAGVDLRSALSDIHAPLPHYRFRLMLQKAVEFCGDVKALGAALLAALEKKDGEAMALLRAGHEVGLLESIRHVKTMQVDEAKEALEGLRKSRSVVETRWHFYREIEKVSDHEKIYKDHLVVAHSFGLVAQGIQAGVSAAHLLPNFDVGTAGWAATPVVKASFGGNNLGSALQAAAGVMSMRATHYAHDANMASIQGAHERRWAEWKLQEELASKELEQIDKQIAAAEIRLAIAEKDLENHDRQIENAKGVDAFMREKFTNQELYNWMVSQVSGLYFQGYQMAYELAKRTERALRHELALPDANFITFGHWDNLKKGLLAGEKLHHDLKRMEVAYLERNRREYELTKHVSLAQLNPLALLQLKQTGECEFAIPEMLFDLDHPGHYMRRIKAVSLTIPCVVGPYTSVGAKLTLTRSRFRTNADIAAGYAYGGPDDDRFAHDPIGIQSIATSTAQRDAGLFELNFGDDRYLPFEGAGAVSEWHLELPGEHRQFDYHTISDVILHVQYTAREGGDLLHDAAVAQITQLVEDGRAAGSVRLFSVRHEFPGEWHRFKTQTPPAGHRHELALTLRPEHYPFWAQGRLNGVSRIDLLARSSRSGVTIADRAIDGNTDNLNRDAALGDLLVGRLTAIPLPTRPTGEVTLYFENAELDDFWLAVSWTG